MRVRCRSESAVTDGSSGIKRGSRCELSKEGTKYSAELVRRIGPSRFAVGIDLKKQRTPACPIFSTSRSVRLRRMPLPGTCSQ